MGSPGRSFWEASRRFPRKTVSPSSRSFWQPINPEPRDDRLRSLPAKATPPSWGRLKRNEIRRLHRLVAGVDARGGGDEPRGTGVPRGRVADCGRSATCDARVLAGKPLHLSTEHLYRRSAA